MIQQMSKPVPCPKCGTENRFQAISILDVDDQPDWRDKIVKRTLSLAACKQCRTKYRGPPKFTYFDREHDQWIGAFPWEARDDWRESEQQAQSLFDVYLNSDTSLSERMHAAPVQRRVTFGWEALREKVVAARRRIDDVSLELLKWELRQPPSGVEDDFRLLEADDSKLIFGRVVRAREEIVEQIAVPRPQFDAVSTNADLRKLREQLSQSAYVDVRRLAEEHKAGE